MTNYITRIFLDTNIYIIGAADRQSNEGQILNQLGFWQKVENSFEVVVSEALLEEISRVAKRLRHKDWSGELIGRIFQNLNVHYVFLHGQDFEELEAKAIPREDIKVYLTAKSGQARYFISANHELICSLVEDTQEFECMTPGDFVASHLVGNSD